MWFGIAGGTLFILGQFVYYFWYTPERTPQPVLPFHKMAALGLYRLAYMLSLLRLPFAVLPYCVKLFGALALKKHYAVSHYLALVEALRALGDIVNWGLGIVIMERIGISFPSIKVMLYASIGAEALRLFAEKGQIVGSACWQILPHRQVANFLSQKLSQREPQSTLSKHVLRYCQYYALDDENRIQYILNTLRCYAGNDPQAVGKLAYLTTLRVVPSSQGMRGGHVRDVARGEVFIHRQWLSDPALVIGQAMRRAPWMFDPRFLRRPFFYRSESNRLATLFVLTHARYSPTYALYQFGHEIKVARYDFFYRILRWLKLDIEPKVQADGTFPFDQGLRWLSAKLCDESHPRQAPLWTDEDVIADIRHQPKHTENPSALDIAVYYTYPLKYVEEVLMAKINGALDYACVSKEAQGQLAFVTA